MEDTIPAADAPAVAPPAKAATAAASKAVKTPPARKAAKTAKPAIPAAASAPAPAPAPTAAAAKTKKAARPAKDTRPPKADKLVRDSFTIPRAEYTLLQDLKTRVASLGQPAKKSELLRAGIQALKALDDDALLALLRTVPVIKTGRPTRD